MIATSYHYRGTGFSYHETGTGSATCYPMAAPYAPPPVERKVVTCYSIDDEWKWFFRKLFKAFIRVPLSQVDRFRSSPATPRKPRINKRVHLAARPPPLGPTE